MGRNIVIFSDGTGQRGGLVFDERRSNIYKLYRAARCGPSPQPRPAPTGRALIAQNVKRGSLLDADPRVPIGCRLTLSWSLAPAQLENACTARDKRSDKRPGMMFAKQPARAP
jgi:hypothetical protein